MEGQNNNSNHEFRLNFAGREESIIGKNNAAARVEDCPLL